MELSLVKEYLRLDFDDDDFLIIGLINAVDFYLKSAISNWDILKEQEKYKETANLLTCAIVKELYDTRGVITGEYEHNTVIGHLITQLDIEGSKYGFNK